MLLPGHHDRPVAPTAFPSFLNRSSPKSAIKHRLCYSSVPHMIREFD